MSATRSSRKTTPVPTAPSTPKSATPSTSRGAVRDRDQSPMSPTRLSRLQEKHELANLNDRLHAYIERNRSLECSKSSLTTRLKTIHEDHTAEINRLKNLYESEIANLRKTLDNTANSRVKLELERDVERKEKAELAAKFKKVTNDFNKADADLRSLQNKLNDLTNKMNASAAEMKKLQADNKGLTAEINGLRKELDKKGKLVQQELMLRTEAENRVITLEDSLRFKEEMCNQLSESRMTTSTSMEYSQVDSAPSAATAATRLAENANDMNALREQFDEGLKKIKEEMKNMYEGKLKNAQTDLNNRVGMCASQLEQIKKLKKELEATLNQVKDLEGKNADLRKQLTQLDGKLNEDRMMYTTEVAHLKDEMSKKMQEYHELLDSKVALNAEITMYRRMLESEETRLHLTPNASGLISEDDDDDDDYPSAKRLRLSYNTRRVQVKVNATHTGDIEIYDVCPEGKFVKIINNGKEEISLGNYQLIREVEGCKPHLFKMNRLVKIPPRGIVTIWSASTKETHDPPLNLVMKRQEWPVGDEMETSLLDKDDHVVAQATHKVETETYSTASASYPGMRGEMANGARDDGCCIA